MAAVENIGLETSAGNLWGRLLKTASIGALSLAMCVSAASARQAPQDTGGDEERTAILGKVVVTGTKKGRGEELQKTASSITALGEQQIDALFANSISDLDAMAPNVELREESTTLPGTANFYIRGTGVAGSVPSDDPAVAVVIDGMPLGMTIGVMTDPFDLEAVEILRGPQGTLFGRNATGGAVVLRSKRPSGEFGARLRGAVGSYNLREVSAAVEGALAESVAGKIAVQYKERDGYLSNVAYGGRQGEQQSLLVRPIIRFEPKPGMDFTLIGEVGAIEGDGPSIATRDSAWPGNPSPSGEWQTNQNFKGYGDIDWRHLIGEGNIDFAGGVLTSITAYREMEQTSASDADGLQDLIFNIYNAVDQSQFSQELRWSGPIMSFADLTTGVYFFDQDFEYRERRRFGPLLAASGANIGGGGSVEHEAAAVFAELDFALSQKLELVLGGRYTYEKKAAEISVVGVDCPSNSDLDGPIDFTACVPGFIDDKSWYNFAPKAGLNYQLGENAFLFASWSKGFRSGGYNVRSTNPAVPPGPYEPETVEAWEVGGKFDLLDDRLRLNTAVFNNVYKDLQRTVIDSQARQIVLNAAEATIRGAEIELVAAVTDDFTVLTSVGYTDASYDRYDGLPGATRPVDKLMLQNVPEWSLSFGGIYTHTFDNGVEATLRSTYSYTDEVAHDNINSLIEPGVGLLDASMSFVLPRKDIEVSIYGNNILDEFYNSFAFTFGPSVPSWVGPPATYGIRITYDY